MCGPLSGLPNIGGKINILPLCFLSRLFQALNRAWACEGAVLSTGLRSSYAMSWRCKAPLLLLVDCSLFSLIGYSIAEAAGPPRGGAHAGQQSCHVLTPKWHHSFFVIIGAGLFSLTAVPRAYLYFNAHKTSAKKQPF